MPRPLPRPLTVALAALVMPLAGLVAAGSAPATGAGSVIVDQADKTGDVKVFHEGGTNPNAAQKRSIDVSRFTVTRRAGTVRFAWTIAQLTTSTGFDQVLDVSVEGTEPGAVWFFYAQASPQHPDGGWVSYSPTLDGDDVVRCRSRLSVQRRTNTVRVDVPRKCIPTEPGVMRAGAYTGHFRAEGVGDSEDTVRVRGPVDLG